MQNACFYVRGLLLILMMMLLNACSSTTLRTSWTPEGSKGQALNKVAVFVLSENKERVLVAESVIATQLGSIAQPGHLLLQAGEEGNKELIEMRLRALGYDGAVSVRLLSVDDKEKYVPPMVGQAPPNIVMPGYMPGMGFYNYYGHAFQQTQVLPGYTVKYKEVVVESIAYSLRSNDAVWVGITETRSPESVSDAAEEIGAAIRTALHKAGLLGGCERCTGNP